MNKTDEEIFERLVKEKLSTDEIFEFEGQNCGEWQEDDVGCNGWNGIDRRCECGNRRVAWVLSDCKTYIYAEAW